MKLKKLLLISGGVLLAAGVTGFTIVRAQSGYTKVLTARVVRQNLVSIVSGTGQIKPKTYVNIGATSFGRITHLYVKEGDHVKKGQVLATVESVQARAGVDAQEASIRSADTDIASYLAAEKTAEATVDHAQADLNQKLLDWQRAQALYKAELIAKSEYDSKKAAYDTDVATLAESNAALVQARAQTASARGKLGTAKATLTSNIDALNKTVSIAPFDGIVTNMPVREGETVVVGIQNAEGSTLMTLADLSVITAEVKVDETDIVNVAMGQQVSVSVDALPGKVFPGTVTEVGDQAILRSTGIGQNYHCAAPECLDHSHPGFGHAYSSIAQVWAIDGDGQRRICLRRRGNKQRSGSRHPRGLLVAYQWQQVAIRVCSRRYWHHRGHRHRSPQRPQRGR
jgi:HlyD family secretion protein